MTPDSSTNFRLENVERAVGQLSDKVGDIAKFMERLVSIEERNGFMSQKHDELRAMLKEAVVELHLKNMDLEKKVTALRETMIRMLAIFSVISWVAALVAPYLLKAILSLGAPA